MLKMAKLKTTKLSTKKPKVIILCGDGINCEQETAKAFEEVGGETELVLINELLSNPKKIYDYQILALPGGFSYGDDLGSGKLLALKLEFRLKDDLENFIERNGLIIGICNGFQILTQLGLLPFRKEEQVFALAANQSERFQNEWVRMRVEENNHSLWLRGLENESFLLPIRHGEGRLVCNDPRKLNAVEEKGMAALRYEEDVNGSLQQIAGLCDESGRVFGLMPHPECAVWEKQLPERSGKTIGRRIFSNAIEYFL